MPLSYASDSGATRICHREAKARERSDQAGGGCGRGYPSSHGREIFANSCMKTAFSRTLTAFIRGSLCRGIDQFPPLFLFLLNLSQTFFFFFLNSFLSVFLLFSVFYFSFSPFLFSFIWSPVRQRGGGGTLPPLLPPPLGTLLLVASVLYV